MNISKMIYDRGGYLIIKPIHPNNKRNDLFVYRTCTCATNNLLQIRKNFLHEGANKIVCSECGCKKIIYIDV